ncbi:MAG TPA: hypothetical protein VGS41_16780 [Chthonomonadales bacterium]|nr:hypothetical protein [Chthonomonadales bacterium]
MKRSLALVSALSFLACSAAFAAPPKQHVKPTKKAVKVSKAAKITDVWTCPITGDKTTAATQAGKPVVVGKYRVHFCCGGCPGAFAKLSKKQQLAKAVAAAKKDSAKKS